jgi:hypothetical protein
LERVTDFRPLVPIPDPDPKLMVGQPTMISSDSDAAHGWTQHSSPQVSADDRVLSVGFTLSHAPRPITHDDFVRSHFPLEVIEHRLQYMSGAPHFSERYLIECADLNPDLLATATEQRRLAQYKVQNQPHDIPSFWPPRCYDSQPFADPIPKQFPQPPKGEFVVRLPTRKRYRRPNVSIPPRDSDLETEYSDF